MILIVAILMDLMDSTIANVALPSIGDDLSANAAQLKWIITGFTIASFAASLADNGDERVSLASSANCRQRGS